MCIVIDYLLVFSFGAVGFFVRTYFLFAPEYIVFFLGDPHTHLARVSVDADRFTLKRWWSMGGVGVGGTNKPTHRPTHPANDLPTNSHPSTHTYPATMQGLCADMHFLTMESIPILLLEHRTKRTAGTAA